MEQPNSQPHEIKHSRIAAFFTALRFLTVIPAKWYSARDGELFGPSLFYFVPVGLIIGWLGIAIFSVAATLFPTPVVAFILVFFLAAISGFLHLDGLADSADGLLSARPKEQSLAIMKDSRSGAMGVVVLVLILIGKFAALSSMPGDLLFTAVFCMPLAGRCSIVVTMAMQRYARPEGGLGNLFYSTDTRYAALLGSIIVLCSTILIGSIYLACVIFGVILFTVYWFSSFCKTRIGGVTGDTLGAVCELTEMTIAVALTAFI